MLLKDLYTASIVDNYEYLYILMVGVKRTSERLMDDEHPGINFKELNEAPENFIPDNWVGEDGVRHIIVWDLDMEIRYRLEDGKVLIEQAVF